MAKVYEVYQCVYKGDVVYIGQGNKGRHKHCNSGTSHVFRLNEIYFKEGEEALSVEVMHLSKDKELVLLAEKDYIRKHQPVFNSVFTNHFKRNDKATESKRIKGLLLSYEHLTKLKHKKDLMKYKELVSEFYTYFGYKSILDKNIYLYGYNHYKGVGKNRLALLSRYIRVFGVNNIEKENVYTVFYRVLIDLFGINLLHCLKSSLLSNIK